MPHNTATLAIDPGNIDSAYVLLDGTSPGPFSKWPNESMANLLRVGQFEVLPTVVIEMIACHGMAVGAETFETVYWIGRFAQIAMDRGMTVHRRFRKEVVLHHCHNVRAKDGNVRQALIDRFGGQALAIGGVKCPKCKGKGWIGRDHEVCDVWLHPPGPLHGVAADVWQALALGLMFVDKKSLEKEIT